MKAASIAELKKELVRLDPGELLDACLSLARFKKDNKELSPEETTPKVAISPELRKLYEALALERYL